MGDGGRFCIMRVHDCLLGLSFGASVSSIGAANWPAISTLIAPLDGSQLSGWRCFAASPRVPETLLFGPGSAGTERRSHFVGSPKHAEVVRTGLLLTRTEVRGSALQRPVALDGAEFENWSSLRPVPHTARRADPFWAGN